MNSAEPIGGYFELELPSRGKLPFHDSILLSSGRNCFEYILRANDVHHVYMPKFTCDVMFEPLKKLNIAYSLYSITDELEIADPITLKTSEMLLYVNYFGIKDEYSAKLHAQYGEQFILDCSQAFYFTPLPSGHTFYSPRKFFGLSDGGCLITPRRLNEALPIDTSYQRSSHLLERIDLGAEAGYKHFQTSDESLSNQPMKQMSNLTKRLLESIDYDHAAQARKRNFEFLHAKLAGQNMLSASLAKVAAPMVYPFQSNDKALRRRLIDQKIFVATYWPNILADYDDGDLEFRLAQSILPLPIDQRYGDAEMARIVEAINAG